LKETLTLSSILLFYHSGRCYHHRLVPLYVAAELNRRRWQLENMRFYLNLGEVYLGRRRIFEW